MNDLSIGGSELIDSSLIDFSRYLPEFIAEQDIKENSKGTYKRALTQFFSFMATKALQPTSNDILEYKKLLISQELAAYTITAYLVVVRKFFAWTESKKIYPNIARTIKGMKPSRGFRKICLSNTQIEEVLRKIDRTTIRGIRDFAIINLLLRTGLRTIEIQRADASDIVNDARGKKILEIQGKGRDTKDGYVVLTDSSLQPILDYWAIRGKRNNSEPLFTSVSDRNNGSRMTTGSISRIVKDALRKVGIDDERLTAHSLRHTAITNALLGGATLQQVKEMARHSNINTTLIYSHNLERMNDSAEEFIDKYMGNIYAI